jgi:cellobiose-specific phosphotransferase system component IIC
MVDKLANLLLKIRRLSIFRVFQRTLVMLMPIAIIGAYFQLMRNAVFSPDSFIYNVLNLMKLCQTIFGMLVLLSAAEWCELLLGYLAYMQHIFRQDIRRVYIRKIPLRSV